MIPVDMTRGFVRGLWMNGADFAALRLSVPAADMPTSPLGPVAIQGIAIAIDPYLPRGAHVIEYSDGSFEYQPPR